MVPRRYSSEAIVLGRRNFSEADRILTVYSKHYGKLTLIAKGVRKPKSRKRGYIEVFSHIKFSAARGKNMDIVTEVDLVDRFPAIRKSLNRASLAYYFMEVVGRLTQEEKNYELFMHLLESLKRCGQTNKLKDLKSRFIYKTLVILGFWPKQKKLVNEDKVLEDVVERELNSKRIAQKVLQ